MEFGRIRTSSASSVGAMTATTALIDTFLGGRNSHTLAAYRHDLRDFARFAGADTPDAAVAVLLAGGYGAANALALAYKNHLIARGLSAATVNRRLATLRTIVAFARAVGVVPWKLTVVNQKVHTPHETAGSGQREVEAVLAMLEERGTWKTIRDRAIICLLYDLALQRAEVVSLDREHLDLAAGILAVLGKGRTAREPMVLPEPTKEALRTWLTVRGDQPGPLFPSFRRGKNGNGRVTDRTVHRVVRRYGEAMGLRMRPHELRRAAIIQALTRTNGDVAVVQRFSRHKTIKTVKIYNTHRVDQACVAACEGDR